MKHNGPKVAIYSSRLRRRRADVEAIAGLPAADFRSAADDAQIICAFRDDPDYAAAVNAAGARKCSLITLSSNPIRIIELESSGRPLGYRVEGDVPSLRDDLSRDAALLRLAEIMSVSPTYQLEVERDFDPDDPSLVWLDPYDRRRIGLERALDIADDLVRARARTALRSFAVGVTRWKRPIANLFLGGVGGPPVFLRRPSAAAEKARAASGRVVVWASRRTEEAEREAAAAGVPLGRLEDGFLRSVGLGAAFVGPLSLVLDERGIYYDPSRPSDLEVLLSGAEIPEPLIARAAALRRRLVAEKLTKYNVGAAARRVVPEGRTGVLVTGQVEDDASILKGAGAIRTNRDLLAAARERRPDAFIVYKPHPDVVAGYRSGAVPPADLEAFADAVVPDGSIAELYPQCAALETMTSLAGFEALLRGLEVTTHGQPFYAGWGLTEDLAPHPRRGRARTIDELVAAALILYPLYVDPVSKLPCGPETVLDRLAAARERAATPSGRRAALLRTIYARTRHALLDPIAKRLR